MTMKCQPLLKSQIDCLVFGVEGFILCNLWQEGEGTGEKKKGSKFLQLQFVTHWRVIVFGLLTAAACWQLWACTGFISMLHFFAKQIQINWRAWHEWTQHVFFLLMEYWIFSGEEGTRCSRWRTVKKHKDICLKNQERIKKLKGHPFCHTWGLLLTNWNSRKSSN